MLFFSQSPSGTSGFLSQDQKPSIFASLGILQDFTVLSLDPFPLAFMASPRLSSGKEARFLHSFARSQKSKIILPWVLFFFFFNSHIPLFH